MSYAVPHTGPFGSHVFKSSSLVGRSMKLDRSQEYEPGQLSALSNNIMKVSSEALTYGQVKSVHGQISRDCSLLRNRVRLLQSEMDKSNRKIAETTRRTDALKKVREDNFIKF